ncbi:MAG: hypothetical protein AB7S50_02650 [Bacteroidales bacterium]
MFRFLLFFLTYSYIFLLPEKYLIAQDKDTSSAEGEDIHFQADFFDTNNPLIFKLTFDIKKLESNKDSDNYMPATIAFALNDSVEIIKNVKIKPRGNTRKDICYFPPYTLNFKKSDVTDDLPSDIDKIKVVTHCISTKEYTSILLKEYLAYKLFNIITDYSFKTRLARITYVDIGRKNKTDSEWAILIEPEDMLAERVDALPIKQDNLSHSHLDSLHSTIMVFFQYMIGNTDFSLAGRHNLKLLKLKDHHYPLLIPVPYDFDYAGMVDAHYSAPTKALPITKVTERYYNGVCRSDSLYNQVINHFLNKEQEIFKYINSFDLLDKKSKKWVTYYIKEFYKEIKSPNFIKRNVKSTCF